MTARRALLNDGIVETAEPAAAPRRAVMPALADMAIESNRPQVITGLHAVDGARARATAKITKIGRNHRRVAAPVAAVAAASALGVISTLVPAAATTDPAGDASSTSVGDTAFNANAFTAVSEGQASADALSADIDALAALSAGIDSAVADSTVRAADGEQAAKDKAAAAALAEREAAAKAASTTAADADTSSASSASGSSSATASSSSAQAAVDFALAQLGKPYIYGSTGPSGYDCSGLMVASYAAAGVSIPRTTYAQMAGLTSVSTSDLQVGDLVFFYGGGHVGMYIGNGQVVHAPTEGDVVKIASISSMGGASSAARVTG
ncbi:C40 family peptidase [uncultured Propionibacterium sp.]|uniref:C40 family peptidase n=1 Tax=uncultured Propionibacterium sp. TaxID=218066 RepID=UPI00292EB1AF|nr:C40 family peptidase [uncultured Propionibacterium sp.]